MVGTASTISDQSDASYRSSEDSFGPQMQVKSTKYICKKNKPQHLVTNIEYKLKPHRRRYQVSLSQKYEACCNVSLIAISVYKLM